MPTDPGPSLERLHQVAETLLAIRSADQLFAAVAAGVPGLIEADGAAVLIRSSMGDFFQVVAANGRAEPVLGRLLPVDGSLVGWVVANGEGLSTDDMDADPRSHSVDGLPADLRVALIVPVAARHATIGAVAAFRRRGARSFGELDRMLLRALADQAALGLDRVALLDDARRKELTVEESNRELVEATRLKGQFLANMSHELRTPLNAIIGFSELMAGESLEPEERQDYLESIARNGRHLLGLINGVLDFSRLDAGRMPARLETVDLRRVIEDAVADTASLRSVKRQRAEVEVGAEPLEVVVDPEKIRQVLFNLLSNASKFTGNGGLIAVSAVSTEVPLPIPADRAGDVVRLESRPAVWVAVRDTGIGIAREHLDRLFQPFSQVDASSSRREQGTGLGLSLAKQLVELHGGTVGVESVPGQGSTFWFILPVSGPVRSPKT